MKPQGVLPARTQPQGGGGGALQTPKWLYETMGFVGARGAGDFVLSIRQGTPIDRLPPHNTVPNHPNTYTAPKTDRQHASFLSSALNYQFLVPFHSYTRLE